MGSPHGHFERELRKSLALRVIAQGRHAAAPQSAGKNEIEGANARHRIAGGLTVHQVGEPRAHPFRTGLTRQHTCERVATGDDADVADVALVSRTGPGKPVQGNLNLVANQGGVFDPWRLLIGCRRGARQGRRHADRRSPIEQDLAARGVFLGKQARKKPHDLLGLWPTAGKAGAAGRPAGAHRRDFAGEDLQRRLVRMRHRQAQHHFARRIWPGAREAVGAEQFDLHAAEVTEIALAQQRAGAADDGLRRATRLRRRLQADHREAA